MKVNLCYADFINLNKDKLMADVATTQKIVPNFWFDTQAEEAAKFYTSVFSDNPARKQESALGRIARYGKEGFEIHGMPEGEVLTAEFSLEGYNFVALNGGPHFKPNPSISFIINCDSKEEVDYFWGKLSEGGQVLMPVGQYEFSERYGWVQDRFGLSWQVSFFGQPAASKIMPSFMFTKENYGRAEEAVDFYVSVFKDSRKAAVFHYGPNSDPDREDAVAFADFELEGQLFAAMESAREKDFSFNEAISFLVYCKTQEEIDCYWEKLSAAPEAERCGWLKDKFGVSWQIVPEELSELVSGPDRAKSGRAMEAMLRMKKLDIAELKRAYEGG